MKKTRFAALFIALVFIVSIFSACGTGAGSPPASSAKPETAAPATAQPASSAGSETEPEAEKPLYPLVDEPEYITVWAPIHPFASNYIEGISENPAFVEAGDVTGVYLDANSINAMEMVEKFQIMIASSDYADVIGKAGSLYTGGLDAAVEDGVLIDCAADFEQYMPNYASLLAGNITYKNYAYTDAGCMAAFLKINKAPVQERGLVINQNYLDELNLAAPETYDELHDTLAAFQNKFGTGTLLLDQKGLPIYNTLSAGFGLFTHYSAAESYYPFYINENGTDVEFAYTQESFRQLLDMLSDWYDEGLVYADFGGGDETLAINNSGNTGKYDDFLSGDIAIALCQFNDFPSMEDSADGLNLSPLANVTMEKGEQLELTIKNDGISREWSISTAAGNPGLIMQYFDYLYSEDAIIGNSYGVEDVSFAYVDGEPQFLDTVLQHEGGTACALAIYTRCDNPGVIDGNCSLKVNDESAAVANEVWKSNVSDVDRTYPRAAALTVDESTEFNDLWTDLITYAIESIPKFITGALNTEADFDAFTAQLKEMGAETCTALKQASYDRYLAK